MKSNEFRFLPGCLRLDLPGAGPVIMQLLSDVPILAREFTLF